MLLPKPLHCVIIGLVGFACLGRAFEDCATPANSVGELVTLTEATIVPGEIIGNEQIRRAYLSFGTNEFMFVVPSDVVVQFCQKCPASLTSRKENFSLQVRLLASLPPKADLKTELIKSVEARYAVTNLLEEISIPLMGREGLGVQFQKATVRGDSRFNRVFWAPCLAGILEFTLDSDPKCQKAALQDFDGVITTFCSNEDGKIKVIPRLDRS